MTDADRLSAWIDGYVRVWDSNDPDDIGALFTEDAVYYTAPFREPWPRPGPDRRGVARSKGRATCG